MKKTSGYIDFEAMWEKKKEQGIQPSQEERFSYDDMFCAFQIALQNWGPLFFIIGMFLGIILFEIGAVIADHSR